MATFILRLTDRGLVVAKIIVLVIIFVFLAYMADKVVSLDKLK